MCAALAGAQGMPWPDVDKSRLNFTGNRTITDRVYVAANQLYPHVEYPSSPPVRGVAYLKGQTVTVVWTIRNWNAFRLVGTLTMQAARLKCPGPNTESPPGSGNWSNPDLYLPLAVSPQTVPIDLAPNGGAQNVTVTFTGVPNHVALGNLEVKYQLPLQNVGNGAWGASGSSDLKEKMTRGMHYSNRSTQARLEYRPNDIWYCQPVTGYFPGSVRYYLGDLTRSLDVNQWTQMDCKDFAAGLKLALASHGVGSDVVWLQRANGALIVTNPLCKAGTDASVGANYFVYFEFTHHAIVESAFTYDPAAAYFWDPAGSLYMDPATGWTVDAHWQNQVGNVYRGLVSEPAAPLLPRPVLPIVELKAN